MNKAFDGEGEEFPFDELKRFGTRPLIEREKFLFDELKRFGICSRWIKDHISIILLYFCLWYSFIYFSSKKWSKT